MVEEIKVVVLGERRVGKTALTVRYIRGFFFDEHDPTIDDSYRKIEEVDDRKFLFDIPDLPVYEDYYSAMRDQCIRVGQGFLLVYSIACHSSFESINGHRDQVLRMKERGLVPMVLVGNKCDLESERQVSIEEGQELARSFGCPFFETSAKTNINVTEAFREVTREYIKQDLMKGEAGRPAGLPKSKDCLIM